MLPVIFKLTTTSLRYYLFKSVFPYRKLENVIAINSCCIFDHVQIESLGGKCESCHCRFEWSVCVD